MAFTILQETVWLLSAGMAALYLRLSVKRPEEAMSSVKSIYNLKRSSSEGACVHHTTRYRDCEMATVSMQPRQPVAGSALDAPVARQHVLGSFSPGN